MKYLKDSERNPRKEFIHEIIFEADTPAGKIFDILLLISIVASVFVVMLESIHGLVEKYAHFFLILEWVFTIFFTIEYLLRLYCVYRPMRYATSFFGVIDLLAILPTYLSLFIFGAQSLMVIRALRLLRVFRIFKLGHFINEASIILKALQASRAKITVFVVFIMLMVTIIGSLMYLVEGGQNPMFSSIPRGVYWAIVTLTTVGYGDITPITAFGQFLSAIVMILGYGVIAVPTGIVTSGIMDQVNSARAITNTQACRYCGKEGHADEAEYCMACGETLND